MKLTKSLIIAGSAIGVYSILKKYRKKQRPARIQQLHDDVPASSYKHLMPGEVRALFKQKIEAGEWPGKDEYIEMADAMKTK